MAMFVRTENLKGYAGGSRAIGRISRAGQELHEQEHIGTAGRLVTLIL
jgi:hypothetical protein